MLCYRFIWSGPPADKWLFTHFNFRESIFDLFFWPKSHFARKNLNFNWQIGFYKNRVPNGLMAIIPHTGRLLWVTQHYCVLVRIILPPWKGFWVTIHMIIVVQYNKYMYVVVQVRQQYLLS